MSSSQRRAWTALSERLRGSLPPEAVHHFVDGSHTRRFSDNLLPGLSQAQIATLRDQLARGAGAELRPTRKAKRRAHAPYSSAALAVNAFGRWLGSEEDLRIAGLGGFSETLEIESRQRISHGGGEANLDCLLRANGVVVGVESKLTETLERHEPVLWKSAYGTPAVGNLVEGGWRLAFDESREGRWQPVYLGVEQLIKHALALLSRFPEDELHLVYLWWEPENAADFPEVAAHRDEVADLRNRVGNAKPRLHALTYSELLHEWEQLDGPQWLRDHIDQLRSRYSIEI